jgi:hypothetical protein
MRAAERGLAKHPQVVTRAGGGDRHAWSATVWDRKRGQSVQAAPRFAYDSSGYRFELTPRLDAPIRIVPSVGELGWTP